jgi:hypothetical protein
MEAQRAGSAQARPSESRIGGGILENRSGFPEARSAGSA